MKITDVHIDVDIPFEYTDFKLRVAIIGPNQEVYYNEFLGENKIVNEFIELPIGELLYVRIRGNVDNRRYILPFQREIILKKEENNIKINHTIIEDVDIFEGVEDFQKTRKTFLYTLFKNLFPWNYK